MNLYSDTPSALVRKLCVWTLLYAVALAGAFDMITHG